MAKPTKGRILKIISDFNTFSNSQDIDSFTKYIEELSDLDVALMTEFSSQALKAFSSEKQRRILSRVEKKQ